MPEFKLTSEIIKRSVARTWDKAKLEWSLLDVYEADEPETCLCGHYPIVELCVIQNRLNGGQATVGNCCVKKFVGLPSDEIFQGVKRVRKDKSKSLNPEAINHAFERGWIDSGQHDFYLNVMRKRRLTFKQKAKKLQINELVLQRMRRH
ncbi:MAG: hypothetical protein ABSG77_17105 [Candidatus Acidiferrum sp.]|jgi:hypothetical protein